MTNVLVGSGPLALRPAANLPNIEYHDTDHNIIWRCDGINWAVVAGSSLNANPMQGPGDLMAGGQEGVPVRVPAATADDLVLTSQASAPGGMAFKAGGGGASTLAALTDVTLTSPQEGDLLRYTGGKWRNAAGALVTKLPATWSPADVTLDETATPVTLPANALYLGLSMRITTPTDAGSTPTFGIADATDYIPSANNGGIVLKSDGYFPTEHEDIVANYSASAITGAFSVQADDPITLTYTAGMTPGATKPVVKFVLIYIAGGF